MIDYYLKNTGKSAKTNILKLIIEIERILLIENVEIEESDTTYFPEVKDIISESNHNKLSNLYFTLNKHKNNYPFFRNYFKPHKLEFDKFVFADLFAGCGGLSLGLEQAGFNCGFVNEIDEVFSETHYFNNNIPLSNYFVGDINEILNNISHLSFDFKSLDLVCGGPPCQGFSMANRQRVIDDPRNNLYKAYLNFLQFSQPKFFIMENVKGMANKIDEILCDFNLFLDNKYDIHYSILNAKDFGVPQNRERLIIVGNRIGINTKSIFEDINNEKGKINYVLKDALENLPSLKPKSIKNNNEIEDSNTGFYISKNNYVKTPFLNFINTEQSNYVFNHKNRYNNERDIEIYSRLPQGANSLHHSIADIMPYTSRNHMFKDKYFKLEENKVSKTITSHLKCIKYSNVA